MFEICVSACLMDATKYKVLRGAMYVRIYWVRNAVNLVTFGMSWK